MQKRTFTPKAGCFFLTACGVLLLDLGLTVSASAQTVAGTFTVPQSAFYIGAGGSANLVNFGTQDVYAIGTSDNYKNGALVSSGSAAGPANLMMDRQYAFAPSVQAGYFQHFPDSRWLWGAKFSYSYFGTTSTLRNALLPQAGSYTYTDSHVTVPFTGNAVVRSYETVLNHQMMLTPFVGRSFQSGFFYLGAGPTLSQTRTNLDGVIGFADINGNRTDVSGTPVNFTSSGWVLGGSFQVGATYFLDSNWFLDVNYNYSVTQSQTGNYSGVFTNPNSTTGVTTSGTLVGSSSGSVATQGAMITINRAF